MGLARSGAADTLTAMTTPNTDTLAAPVIRRAGEGDHVLQMSACVTVKLAAVDSEDARVSAAEFLMPASFGPPLHIHHGEDEILQILDGSVRIVCGATDTIVGPGSFAYLPRGVPHTFWVSEAGPARMLAVFTPGGIEAMFVDGATPTDAARLPEPGDIPDGAPALDETGHRIEIVGPPLGA